MADTKVDGPRGHYEASVAAGDSLTFKVPVPLPAPIAILSEPASGAVPTISVTLSTHAEIVAGTANWHVLHEGSANDSFLDYFDNTKPITGYRVAAATAALVVVARSAS